MASKSCYVCCFTFLLTFSSIIRVHGIFLQTVYNTNTSNVSIADNENSTLQVQLNEPQENRKPQAQFVIVIIFVVMIVLIIIMALCSWLCKANCCPEDCCNDQCFNEICCCNDCSVTLGELSRNSSNDHWFRRDSTRTPITSNPQRSTRDVSRRIDQQMEHLGRLRLNLTTAPLVATSMATPPPSYSAVIKEDWKFPKLPAPQSSSSTTNKVNPAKELSTVGSENFAVNELG